jgi:hypothetical protein
MRFKKFAMALVLLFVPMTVVALAQPASAASGCTVQTWTTLKMTVFDATNASYDTPWRTLGANDCTTLEIKTVNDCLSGENPADVGIQYEGFVPQAHQAVTCNTTTWHIIQPGLAFTHWRFYINTAKWSGPGFPTYIEHMQTA